MALATASPIVAQQVSDWQFVWNNAPYLLVGTGVTVVLTALSILLGFLVGLPAGAVEVYGGPYARRAVRYPGTLLRGTPIVVILTFAYFVFPTPSLYVTVPEIVLDPGNLRIEAIRLGEFELSGAFVAGVLGLGLRSGAYQSQIFRGSIQSVDPGQMEAARSLGMGRVAAVRHVVLPQALRRSVPGFQNEATIVLKDTSVVFAIGLAELLTRSYDLFVQQTSAVLEIILFASAIYFVLTFVTNRALDFAGSYYAVPDAGGEHA